MSHSSAVLEACAYFNYKWPEQLTSGIMFFNGQKITIVDFHNHLKLLGK